MQRNICFWLSGWETNTDGFHEARQWGPPAFISSTPAVCTVLWRYHNDVHRVEKRWSQISKNIKRKKPGRKTLGAHFSLLSPWGFLSNSHWVSGEDGVPPSTTPKVSGATRSLHSWLKEGPPSTLGKHLLMPAQERAHAHCGSALLWLSHMREPRRWFPLLHLIFQSRSLGSIWMTQVALDAWTVAQCLVAPTGTHRGLLKGMW